jgi:hypothetical protein
VNVSVPGVPEGVQRGMPVTVGDLVATPSENDRPEDIAFWAVEIRSLSTAVPLAPCLREAGRTVTLLDLAALSTLLRAPWPGRLLVVTAVLMSGLLWPAGSSCCRDVAEAVAITPCRRGIVVAGERVVVPSA